MHWRRQWHPTPVLLPGKSHGLRSLVGCSPWGLEESDTTERLSSTSPPAPNLSQHQGLLWRVNFSYQVAKVLELQLQHQSLQLIFRTDFLYDWLVWSPCNPRDSQESSPIPQFKGINSLALSLLSGSTLISIYDYWKNHSFDYSDLCQQSNVSAF